MDNQDQDKDNQDQDKDKQDQDSQDQGKQDQDSQDQGKQDQDSQDQVKDKKPRLIPLINPETNEPQDFEPKTVIELAQWALLKLSEDDKKTDDKKTDDKKDELTAEERVTKLEKYISDKEVKDKHQVEANRINNVIDESLAKFEYIKDNEKMAKKIKLIVLTKYAHNPRQDIRELAAEEIKDFMDDDERKKKATSKVGAIARGMTRTGSSMPVVDTSKKFTAEDLKGTGSQTALKKFLESD